MFKGEKLKTTSTLNMDILENGLKSTETKNQTKSHFNRIAFELSLLSLCHYVSVKEKKNWQDWCVLNSTPRIAIKKNK